MRSEANLAPSTAASPVTGSFTVAVSGVKDGGGLAMSPTNVPGTLINLTSTSVGSPAGANAAGAKWGPDPQFPATITQWGPGNYDVLCNGNDYWNNADGMNFFWEPKTNSFDVKVRVVSVSPINNWSAGALEIRDGPVTTNGGGWELARPYFIKTDYSGPDARFDGSGTGAKAYELN